jgi:hypothetical protein
MMVDGRIVDHLTRFIQPDTVTAGGPQGLNRYGYSNNNPINYTDPSGHMVDKCGNLGCDADTPTIPIDPTSDNPVQTDSTKDDSGPITKAILALPYDAQTWDDFAIGFDVFAWLLDTYSVAMVTYGGIEGAGIALPFAGGGPEVPIVTGWLGISIAELSVQGMIRTASFLALGSSVAVIVADTKAGNTRIEQEKLGSATVNSLAFSIVGLFDPEAYTSWLLQSSSVANDFGWMSFPLPKTRSQP